MMQGIQNWVNPEEWFGATDVCRFEVFLFRKLDIGMFSLWMPRVAILYVINISILRCSGETTPLAALSICSL